MSGPFQGKTILVLGGSGSIGSAVVDNLLQLRATTYASHYHDNSAVILDALSAEPSGHRLIPVQINVTEPETIRDFASSAGTKFDGIVYAVGECPPQGFQKATDTPLSELPEASLEWKFHLHVYGLQYALQILLPLMKPSCRIVILTSAITRLTDDTCPPWLYAGYYAAAIAAQDELIRWWRRDPKVKENGIWLHRIAPAAVDTPFHEGSPPDRQPPSLLPISKVVDSVIAALLTKNGHVDQTLTPAPPA